MKTPKKLSRENIVWAIGYDGPVALVDRKARSEFGLFSTEELIHKGLFRAAAASAINSDNVNYELDLVAKAYNSVSGASYRTEDIAKLFGVGPVSVQKITAL